MTKDEVIAAMEKAADAQTRKTYLRHGAGEKAMGVRSSDLAKLKSRIKIDHELAAELWKTAIPEARVLSLMVADPARLTTAQATSLVNDAKWRGYGFYLGLLAARSPIRAELMASWMKSADEHTCENGFMLLSFLLKENPDAVSDAECGRILGDIEKRIHEAPNWAKYAMNGAVIAIGGFKPSMTAKAIAAAKRIGKVEVDHGVTACKTPDAESTIRKARARKKK
jgi:3-methyladenine DNA glycosylase AlkD